MTTTNTATPAENSKSKRQPPPREVLVREHEVVRYAELVYRDRLGAGEAERMIAKDKDNGQKLHVRAQSYAPVVRSLLTIIAKEGREVRS
jgi:hypothetical protein